MKSIKAVGFDMDYTLAQYKEEEFESLAYYETIKKLVSLGYPECLYEFKVNTRYVVRGLVIDKRRGNMIKMDRHKYVKIAYHGFRELTEEERETTYHSASGAPRESFDGINFANIDTLFNLAEAYLFCQLVELKDKYPGQYLCDKHYFDLYQDVRRAVDLCHRDGSLKMAIANDPAKYIHEDSSLLPMLKMLQTSGRKTFVVTNSLWDYTNVVMNFLLSGRVGKEINHDWLQYFDMVIVGSAKPGFYADKSSNLFEIDLESGLLMNTDNGSPMVQLDAALKMDGPPPALCPERFASDSGAPLCRAFQGGNFRDLHSMLSVQSGSEVLYAGDHIYGDILRSKKSTGWRTLLLVPELEREINVMQRPDMRGQMPRLAALRDTRAALDDQLQRLQWHLQHSTYMPDEKRAEMKVSIKQLTEERDTRRAEHRNGLRKYHEEFHPVWGQLMVSGYQSSRFAHQIQRFACLYTSHIGNLRGYSPEKSYRSGSDAMPHFEEAGRMLPFYIDEGLGTADEA
eukprot:CAMPEP_0118946524 /NCGR_PEP_ID=MMETSP1169-20130426/44352_1 /TAXON_ID=36882 /ORGANISM="Pyramimonas obovata, Strain CCMP722" /LENGTH=512 /DNA_ID=CAMNT_0006892513 /DNA_START=525 /DNA_END=2063 /DNA_ORIENTATION=+